MGSNLDREGTTAGGDDRVRKVDVTEEVASEGGGTGDVELGRSQGPGTGSESTEVWRAPRAKNEPIIRDETGEGRRS